MPNSHSEVVAPPHRPPRRQPPAQPAPTPAHRPRAQPHRRLCVNRPVRHQASRPQSPRWPLICARADPLKWCPKRNRSRVVFCPIIRQRQLPQRQRPKRTNRKVVARKRRHLRNRKRKRKKPRNQHPLVRTVRLIIGPQPHEMRTRVHGATRAMTPVCGTVATVVQRMAAASIRIHHLSIQRRRPLDHGQILMQNRMITAAATDPEAVGECHLLFSVFHLFCNLILSKFSDYLLSSAFGFWLCWVSVRAPRNQIGEHLFSMKFQQKLLGFFSLHLALNHHLLIG